MKTKTQPAERKTILTPNDKRCWIVYRRRSREVTFFSQDAQPEQWTKDAAAVTRLDATEAEETFNHFTNAFSSDELDNGLFSYGRAEVLDSLFKYPDASAELAMFVLDIEGVL